MFGSFTEPFNCDIVRIIVHQLPADLHATLNTAMFKKNLKTFLFREAYLLF